MIRSIFIILIFLFLTSCSSSKTTTENNSPTIQNVDVPSKLPMLVVLVNYKNIGIKYNETEWSERIFGTLPYQLNHYYRQASASQFTFTPIKESGGIVNDGVVSVTFEKNHPNLDVNDPEFTTLLYPDFKEILEKLDTKVDFSEYDTDKNGALSNKELIITFILAGYEDAYEGYHVKNGVWGHQNCMEDDNDIATLDNIELLSCAKSATFSIFGETHDKKNSYQASIGIIAHELGHATFNLPDLYNTANSEKGGIGLFGIMGAGTWTTSDSSQTAGTSPTHFCAWSKIHNGWTTPLEPHNTQVNLYETTSLNYNIVKIPINDTSYYLLENRNNSGYDKGLRELSGTFDGGIAIWKIDESKMTEQNFLENTVNNDNQNKGVDLVEASDSTIDSKGSGGDEDALYYMGNKNYLLDLVDNISVRGEEITLDILK